METMTMPTDSENSWVSYGLTAFPFQCGVASGRPFQIVQISYMRSLWLSPPSF
jgi:hypothetical protein